MNNCIDRVQLERRTRSYKMREFLDNVDLNWYVETTPAPDGTVQNGSVTGIIRDRYGIAVCLELCGDKPDRTDYISADRVSFWEPYSYYYSDPMDYYDIADVEAMLLDNGYAPSDEDGVWENKDTGDEYWMNGGVAAW